MSPPPGPGQESSWKLNFTPVAWWYQCRICKVLLQHKKQFIKHKRTKHPGVSNGPPVVDLVSSSDDEKNDDKKETKTAASVPRNQTNVTISSSESAIKTTEIKDTDGNVTTEGSSSTGTEDNEKIKTVQNSDKKTITASKTSTSCKPKSKQVTLKNKNKNQPHIKTTLTDLEDFVDGADSEKDTCCPPLTKRRKSTRGRSSISSESDRERSNIENASTSVTSQTLNHIQEEKVVNEARGSTSAAVASPDKPENDEDSESSIGRDDKEALSFPKDGNSKSTSEPALHVCCVCDKAFQYKANLNCHLTACHLSKDSPDGSGKIYKCGLCPKLFRKVKELSQHSWIHTDECRYRCPTCTKGFKQKKPFKDHEKQCSKKA